MYHLLKSLYLHATSLPEYSILLLGLDAAGKTTLLNQIRNIYGTEATSSSSGQGEGWKGSMGESGGGRGGTGKREDRASESAGKTVPTVGQNVCNVSKSLHDRASNILRKPIRIGSIASNCYVTLDVKKFPLRREINSKFL